MKIKQHILLKICFFSLIILSLIFYISFLLNNYEFELETLQILSIIETIVVLVIITFTREVKKYGYSYIFLIYLIITHFGFVISYYFFDKTVNLRSTATMSFIYSTSFKDAICLSGIAIGILTITIWFFSLKYYMIFDNKKQYTFENNVSLNKGMEIVAGLTLVIGTIYIVKLILTNPNIFYSKYIDNWYELRTDRFYGHALTMLLFSYPVILSVSTKKVWKKYFIIYSISIILNLLLGNRGEVMYALLACLAIYTVRYQKIKFRIIACSTSVVLLLISVIRVARVSGIFKSLSSVRISMYSIFVEPFAEMGFQIAPLTYTLEWLKNGGKLVFGGTYLLYSKYFFSHIIPFFDEISLEGPNYVKSFMPKVGLGFSIIAEVYYNFGLLGIILQSVILGYILSKFDYQCVGRYKSPIKAMIIIILINLIRNNGSTIFTYFTYILIFLLSSYFMNLKIDKNIIKTNKQINNINRKGG